MSPQGRVKRVYYPDNPKIKFGFILEDESGFAYVAVWKPSERVITRSTSDPDDADGEVIVSESIFVEPDEGDLVRLTDFRKGEFNDQPSLNSRWDSDVRIPEKAPRTSTRRPPTQHRPIPPTHKRSNAASEDESTGESANAMARYAGDTSTEWPDSDWLNWIISAEIATLTRQSTIAQLTAGELEIPFVELSPGDVTSRWVNASTEQIQVLFQEAQALGPCVIFIDKAEHLPRARTLGDGTIHAEDRKVTSEFLVQLTKENREAIVVSATNRPADIDSAILSTSQSIVS